MVRSALSAFSSNPHFSYSFCCEAFLRRHSDEHAIHSHSMTLVVRRGISVPRR